MYIKNNNKENKKNHTDRKLTNSKLVKMNADGSDAHNRGAGAIAHGREET